MHRFSRIRCLSGKVCIGCQWCQSNFKGEPLGWGYRLESGRLGSHSSLARGRCTHSPKVDAFGVTVLCGALLTRLLVLGLVVLGVVDLGVLVVLQGGAVVLVSAVLMATF